MAITFEAAETVEMQAPFEGNDGVEQVVETSGEGIPPAEEQSEGQESPVPEQGSTELPSAEEPKSTDAQESALPESPSPAETTQPPHSSSDPIETTTATSPSDEASAEARRKRMIAQNLWKEACDRKSAHVGSLALEVAKAKSRLKAVQDSFNEEVEELQELVDRDYYPFMESDGNDDEGRAGDEAVQGVRGGDNGVLRSGAADDSAHHAGGVDQAAASEAAATRWQDRPLVELIAFGAPKSTIENLCELGYETIGRFEALRADIANHREKWPKGIGPGKVTKLENAIVEWGAKNWTAETEAEPPPVVAQDAPPAASVAEATSEPPAAVAMQPEAASESAAMPESAAEVAAKPKRTRKKKEPAAADVQVTEGDAVAAVVSPGPVAPALVAPAFELDGRYIPTIGQWESADNRDRIAWMQSRMETLRELSAQGMFRPEYPGELVRGKSNGKSGGGIGPAAILQPGPKMDSFLWGFSLSQVQEQPKPASEQARPSALDNDDVDLADL